MGEFPYEVRQWARHYGDRIDELTELAGSGVVPYRSTDDALKIVFLKWWEQNKQAIKEGRYSDVKAGKNVEEMETPLSALFLKYDSGTHIRYGVKIEYHLMDNLAL